MAILLYAISYDPLPYPVIQQLTQFKLSLLSCPPLSAMIAPLTSDLPTDKAALLKYSQLIENIRELTDIIPMRYGAVFAHESAICQALQPQMVHYQKRLNEIKHCVEMSVRVLIPPPARLPLQSLSGTDYLKWKQQQTHQYQQYTQEICCILADCYIQYKVEFSAERSLLSLYFLVPISQLNQFQDRIRLFHQQKILVSGPWAAYNFTN